MPFITESLEDIQEAKAAPEGEYILRITKAEEKQSKKGKNMAVIQFAFTDGAIDAPRFLHFILAPDGEDEGQDRMRKIEWKRLCQAAGVDTDVEVTDLVGEEFECFVAQEADDAGVVRNKARLPLLKDEAPAATGRRRR